VDERLVGFVNVAWDGGVHAFLLDTTVHPEYRRHGIGVALVRCAVDEARDLGAEWLHVDFIPEHARFYRRCGFAPTLAGLIELQRVDGDGDGEPAALVRPFAAADAPACRAIFESIPEWFGIQSAVEAYLRDLPHAPTWVATRGGAVAGFICVTRPQPRAVEVHVLAVGKAWHRHGIGRALMEHAERFARSIGARVMLVRTLGPSQPDPAYAMTRAFYLKLGYEPLLETTAFWGEKAPSLLLIKPLSIAS
jgi:GNAT superfamily N-acetyltransferase